MNAAPRGQILIIAAFAMVVLLGIAALVVDLGFAWMLRRAEQNAVDPAAVAAARYISPLEFSLPDRDAAACFFVQEHGFFTDDPGCATALDNGDLYIGTPRSGSYDDPNRYVEVAISVEHVTFFGRIFGQPIITVANSAVAANGGQNVNANALVALDPTSCGAGMLSGNGVIEITPVSGTTGGYVYVNSICGRDPGPTFGSSTEDCDNDGGNESDPHGAMQINGSQATLITDHLYVRGTCSKTSNPWDPTGEKTTEGAGEISDSLKGFEEPNHVGMQEWGRSSCPAPGTLLSPGYGCVFEGNSPLYPITLEPGVYYGGWVIRGQAKLILNSGIYYIAGGGIQMSGSPKTLLQAGEILIFSTGDPTYTGSCADNPDYPPPPPVSWTQHARPDGDAGSDGTWTGTFDDINEEVADDLDRLEWSVSDPPGAADYFEVTLTDADTPASMNGVVVRYRYAKTGDDAGQGIELKVELREGSTLVKSETHTNIPGIDGSGWEEGSFQLSEAEAESITATNEFGWFDLRLRFVPSGTADPDVREALISWAEVEVPPGTAAFEARRCQGKIDLTGGNEFTAKPTTEAPWAGLLIWQDGTFTNAEGDNGDATNPRAKVDLGGQGSMNIAGAIYAPAGKCFLRGNGASDPVDSTAAVQMICWQFEVVGNGGLNIPYDPSQLPGQHQKGLVR